MHDIDSVIKSDHILNLLPEVEGNLKQDKNKIISVLNNFLTLSREEQMIYQVGRRVGYMNSTEDLKNLHRRKAAEHIIEDEGISSNNINLFIENRLNQFI